MSEIEIPSLLFDSAWYLETYTDVAMANADPMDHYLIFGYREGRNPNRYFNTNFYLQTYPDIANSAMNPFIHYIMHGAAEGRLPRPAGTAPLPPIPKKESQVTTQTTVEETTQKSDIESTPAETLQNQSNEKTIKSENDDLQAKKLALLKERNDPKNIKKPSTIATLKARNARKIKTQGHSTISNKKIK